MSSSPSGSRLDRDAPVLVTGGWGMLGKALCNSLRQSGFVNVLAPRRSELDLLDNQATVRYIHNTQPKYVFHLASLVFGLLGNARNQVRSLAENTMLNHNIIIAAAESGVRKFFFAGSVASYPYPFPSLPLQEDMIWAGAPHHGEYGYAHAKRHALAYLDLLSREAGLDYVYGLITNLYGPEDRFDEQNGHVIPSLIKKVYAAKQEKTDFSVWGDGSATRDFMYVDDAADAMLAVMDRASGVINISSGHSISIRMAVEALIKAAEFRGHLDWQTDKPVGVPVRSVSNARLLATGFTPQVDIEQGMQRTWDWFVAHQDTIRI